MKNIFRLLSIVLLFLVSMTAQAGIQPVIRESMSDSSLRADSLMSIHDDLFLPPYTDPSWMGDWKLHKVKNRVMLRVNLDTLKECLPDSFECEMHIKVRYRDEFLNLDSFTKILTVTYKSGLGQIYDEKSVFAFEGAWQMEVEIDSMCDTTLSKYLTLIAELESERYRDLDVGTPMTFIGIDSLMSTKELEIFWNAIDGAEEYDLEWTFVDDYLDYISGNYTYKSAASLPYKFRDNATRVTITSTSYKIRPVFEHGYVLFRVRPVGRTGVDFTHSVYGDWSSPDQGPSVSGEFTNHINSYHIKQGVTFSPHEASLNWQYISTYAEEGKKKEVVSYYDGSLRNRQTVTVINTDASAIVSETFYDHQGRPAINTLPAPTFENKLCYAPDFNLNKDGNPYSRIDFDTGYCDDTAVSMKNTSGASKYYSSNNPYAGVYREYDYIPDAHLFPFAQTEYTPDNTGRIRRQSGVGIDHRLGSDHETKYYYATPWQEELDRLFGNNVGFANHYQKNMVRDANGQYSVSYLDLKGQVVATALAGTNPTNLDQLDNYASTIPLTVDLLSSSDTLYEKGRIITSKTFVVAEEGEYTFSYGINGENFTDDCLPDICYDCVYDLTISLIDECGNEQLDGDINVAGNSPIIVTVGPPLQEIDSLCDGEVGFQFIDSANLDTVVTLQPGTYTITKVLSVNSAALDFYTQHYLENDTCLKTLDDFEEEFWNKTDTTHCDMSCAECVHNLGAEVDFITEHIERIILAGGTPSAQDTTDAETIFQALTDECNARCDSVDFCEAGYKMILADVSPGGQYALFSYSDQNDQYTAATGSLLEADPDDDLDANILYDVVGTSYLTYYDENGNLDYILFNGTLQPMNGSFFSQIYGNTVLYSEFLQVFIDNFKPSWAKTLAPFHPEYCEYQWCIDNAASNAFDRNMLSTETYAEALAAGYFHPVGSALSPYEGDLIDPYFDTDGEGSGQLSAMASALASINSSGYSAWELPVITYICYNETTSPGLNTCLAENNMGSDNCGPYQDAMWHMFRGLYLAEKRKFQEIQKPGGCPTDAVDSLQKKRRYLSIDEDLPDMGFGDTARIGDSIEAHCLTICESYADEWIRQLESCSLSPSDTARLKDSLINICFYGCDADHPMGSSSVAPGNSGYVGYTNFQAAIAGITLTNCDADLIEFPKPYGHDYFGKLSPYSDTCVCDYGGDTSLSAADTCACGTKTDSLRLSVMIGRDIPDQFKCESCIDCEQLYVTLAEIDNEYGGAFPDSNWTLKKLLETQLNRKLGFNLTYYEYLNFMTDCLGDSITTIYTLDSFRYKYNLFYNYQTAFIPDETWDIPNGTISPIEYEIMDEGTDKGYKISMRPINEMDTAIMVMIDNYSYGKSIYPHPIKISRTLVDVPLDSCGCNTILMAKDDYNPDGGGTFQDYFESLYPSLAPINNINDLEEACRKAYESDGSETSSITGANSPWSSHQYMNLTQYTLQNGLTMPEGLKCDNGGGSPCTTCGNGSPSNPKLPCDSLQKYSSQFLEDFLNSGDTNQLYSDEYNKQLGHYMDSVFGNMAPFFEEVGDSGYMYWIERLRECGDTNMPECTNCYGENEIFFLFERFLDTLTTSHLDLIHKSNWNFETEGVENYYNTALGDGTVAENLFYNNVYGGSTFYGGPPKGVIVEIEDNPSHFRKFLLWLPSGNDGCWGFINIKEFFDMKIQSAPDCGPSEYFTIQAVMELGAACAGKMGHGTSLDTITMYGKTYFPLETDIFCTAPNIRLCNRPLFPQDTFKERCKEDLLRTAQFNAKMAYAAYIDSVRNDFQLKYMEKCMSAGSSERFTMKFDFREYHYTLYYYDQVGNLTKTVPPAGVNPITNSIILARVKSHRETGSGPATYPTHALETHYRYNTLNQLTHQETPDAGESDFFYDRLGRLVVSQNARQEAETDNRYSFTEFDALGRITEVGEISTSTTMTVAKAFDESQLTSWLAGGTKTEITNTYYDNVEFTGVQSMFNNGQDRLRSRVVSTTYREMDGPAYQHAVHYSYDIHGNVDQIVREVDQLSTIGQQYKKVEYDYDLVSGNVNKVRYQEGYADQYFHYYEYDADNRITDVYTGQHDGMWDRDAKYLYYLHGPMYRTELGQLQVQGIDYAYTIHGWLKGVNSNTLYTNRDIGQDASMGGVNCYFGKDEFGFSLGYYDGDYNAIGNPATADHAFAAIDGGMDNNSLYNGNIRHMITAIGKFMEGGAAPMGYAYQYDQLNRIAGMDAFNNLTMATNQWGSSITALTEYHTEYTYDPNGNILSLLRNGSSSQTSMDNLTYHYTSGTNQLEYVDDAVAAGNYSVDIDDQSAGNYTYDEIGNLVSDDAEEIEEIVWTVYGKIKEINRTTSSLKPDLAFEYTPDGHRAMKIVKPKTGDQFWIYTYYVRDAQGNVMATYTREIEKDFRIEDLTFEEVNDLLIAWRDINQFAGFIDAYDATPTVDPYEFYLNYGTEMAQDIIAAGNEIPFLYAFDPSGILAANTTLYNNTLAQYSQIEFVRAMVNNIGLGSYLASICNTGSLSFITHSYNYNRTIYLNSLAGVNLTILQNMYAALIGTPWPGTGPAIAQLVGLPPGNVETWLNNNGGCGLNASIVGAMSATDYEIILASYTQAGGGGAMLTITQITDGVYGYAQVIVALDSYNRNMLWDNMHATSPTPNLVLTALSTFSNFTVEAAKQYPSYIAPIQESYRGAHSMEAYFDQIATYFGQSLQDSMLDSFNAYSDRFEDIYSLDEWHIYGNQRHGTDKIDSLKIVVVSFRGEYDTETGTYTPLVQGMDTILAITTFTLNDSAYICKRGRKRYELSNHLGNVLVVISDKKLHECDTVQDTFMTYRAEVLAAQDYYPFGMLMPDRIYEADTTYRYAYQGSETDPELSGKGNTYTTEYRMLDVRLGRWFSIDPKYTAWESPYVSMSNNPLYYIDPFGDTIIVDKVGTILRKDVNDEGNLIDNFVYMQNDEGGKDYMGELGKNLDANVFFKNLLEQNSKIADDEWDPREIRKKFDNGGEWDYKNNENNIIGLAHSLETSGKLGPTTFLFNGMKMQPGDLGNFHYGVVGKAFGLTSEVKLLRMAGEAEQRKWKARGKEPPKEWFQYRAVRGHDGIIYYDIIAPYGDNPKDQYWIKQGFKYYDENRENLDGDKW